MKTECPKPGLCECVTKQMALKGTKGRLCAPLAQIFSQDKQFPLLLFLSIPSTTV